MDPTRAVQVNVLAATGGLMIPPHPVSDSMTSRRTPARHHLHGRCDSTLVAACGTSTSPVTGPRPADSHRRALAGSSLRAIALGIAWFALFAGSALTYGCDDASSTTSNDDVASDSSPLDTTTPQDGSVDMTTDVTRDVTENGTTDGRSDAAHDTDARDRRDQSDDDTFMTDGVDDAREDGVSDALDVGPEDPFLYARLDDTERLRIETNLPPTVDACSATSPSGVSCDDADRDGLLDPWEDALLVALVPRLRFDEAEPHLDDPDAVLHAVARVTPVTPLGDSSLRVHVYMMIGYSRDYGSCGGLSSHNGDSERVAFALRSTTGPGELEADAFYTAAHENTANDHSTVYDALDPVLVFEDDGHPLHPDAVRWTVFPSASKHATYASIDICENVARNVPCLDEDCGLDGGVADPSRYVVVPPVINAGEPEAPRVSALDGIGFPGDDAWLDQKFCGGRARDGGCSASVREKLTTDPFASP